eukprot:5371799-Prymnesium_polylepis.4
MRVSSLKRPERPRAARARHASQPSVGVPGVTVTSLSVFPRNSARISARERARSAFALWEALLVRF